MSEPSNSRVLANELESSTNMTVGRCLGECWMYKYAGLEYGQECWCGNTLNFAGNSGATPGANVSESQCNKVCGGNSSEYCGAGVRLTLYEKLKPRHGRKMGHLSAVGSTAAEARDRVLQAKALL